ncbi:hypothetical protein G6F46_013902 [Rhizopus delemar]|nr:hypothetical protein G6F52_014164 [Rhizopus delemar]KAG1602146.1 hypothetical protein G6F46_013902 [Rhizopus delemar]KAG1608138.1 hypothetical protein G6F45_013643 [Rhizopus arrhizus]
MHGESASVDISSENIQNELRKIEELLGPYDPVDIMNFDETGLYYQQPPRRTICSESLGGLKKVKLVWQLGCSVTRMGLTKGTQLLSDNTRAPSVLKQELICYP